MDLSHTSLFPALRVQGHQGSLFPSMRVQGHKRSLFPSLRAQEYQVTISGQAVMVG